MSLKIPEKKMSKSDSPDSFIALLDIPENIKKKIAGSTTDSEKKIKFDPKKKPGVSNLLTIYSLFSEEPIKELEKQFKNKGYQEFKQTLGCLLIEKLEPFRSFASNPAQLEKILGAGAKKAKTIARKTMKKVRKNMGLV